MVTLPAGCSGKSIPAASEFVAPMPAIQLRRITAPSVYSVWASTPQYPEEKM